MKSFVIHCKITNFSYCDDEMQRVQHIFKHIGSELEITVNELFLQRRHRMTKNLGHIQYKSIVFFHLLCCGVAQAICFHSKHIIILPFITFKNYCLASMEAISSASPNLYIFQDEKVKRLLILSKCNFSLISHGWFITSCIK